MQTHQCADKYSALREASILQADGADSVIIMGVTNDKLKYLTDNHISVFGHVGILSGENGMCGMTIENVQREVTNAVAKKLHVPVIGVPQEVVVTQMVPSWFILTFLA